MCLCARVSVSACLCFVRVLCTTGIGVATHLATQRCRHDHPRTHCLCLCAPPPPTTTSQLSEAERRVQAAESERDGWERALRSASDRCVCVRVCCYAWCVVVPSPELLRVSHSVPATRPPPSLTQVCPPPPTRHNPVCHRWVQVLRATSAARGGERRHHRCAACQGQGAGGGHRRRHGWLGHRHGCRPGPRRRCCCRCCRCQSRPVACGGGRGCHRLG